MPGLLSGHTVDSSSHSSNLELQRIFFHAKATCYHQLVDRCSQKRSTYCCQQHYNQNLLQSNDSGTSEVKQSPAFLPIDIAKLMIVACSICCERWLTLVSNCSLSQMLQTCTSQEPTTLRSRASLFSTNATEFDSWNSTCKLGMKFHVQ